MPPSPLELPLLVPERLDPPEDQRDRDMIARELLVTFQMSPRHLLVELKKAHAKF